MVALVGRLSAVERVSVCDPGSSVAAWFTDLPDGRVLLAVNRGVVQTTGAGHYAEAWYRLNAVVRGRSACVLSVSEIAQVEHLFSEHRHATLSA